jgi:Ca-activated chloride channel family protein
MSGSPVAEANQLYQAGRLSEDAAALDIKVYTIGMGRPGQVPFPVNAPLFGRTTRLIESEIDENTLQRIAETTNATCFWATDTSGLRQIYEEIDRIEKSEVELQAFTRYKELAGWFLFPALVLLVIDMVLRYTWFRTLP